MASNPTFADVTRALARHSERTSKAEANRVLESAVGTNSLRDIDPALFAKAIAALDGVDEDDGDEDEDETLHAKPNCGLLRCARNWRKRSAIEMRRMP